MATFPLVVGGSPDPPTRVTEGLTDPAKSVRPSVGAVGRSGDRPTTGVHPGAPRTPKTLVRRLDCFTASERKATSVLGFSLIELLIVISIMGIFAGVVLTSFDPSIHDRLQGTAQILATDIAYARDLAVTNNSTYTITFDTTTHQYVIEHSGTNTALETLPETPFRNPSDPPDQQITDLQNLPFGGGPVELIAVHDLTPSIVTVTDVEFGPLGETTRSFDMQIWLAAGEGEARRYLPMLVHPVTGLTTLGELQTEAPPGPD